MEEFIKFFTHNFYQFAIGGFFTFISFIAGKAYKTYKKSVQLKQESINNERAEQALIKMGLLSLLRFRINRLCHHIASQGYMTVDERHDLTDLFDSYKALGGNSRTEMVVKNVLLNFKLEITETSELITQNN